MKSSYITGILMALVVVASGCAESSTTSSPDSPDEAVQNYFDSITGFNQDYESAYELLSSDVQAETSLADYDVEMTNLNDAQTGASFEMQTVETLEETNTTATVNTTVKIDLVDGAYNEEKQVELVKEDGEWKLDEKFHPFNN